MISMASLQAIKLRRFCRLWRKLIEKAFQTWLEEDIEQQIEKKKEIFTDENLYVLLKSVAEEEAEKKKRGPFITMNSEDVHSSFSPSSYFEGCNQGVWDYNGTITFYLEPLQQLFYEIKRKKLLHYQEISNYEASFESWKSSVTHQRKSYILGQENHRQ